MEKTIDVLIIGAGQAGLALGYYLKQSGMSFILVDASERIGDVWRNRYDSLVLFSPRKYSSLPGMILPGDPEGFPAKDEFADYLGDYAEHFALPVHLNTKVEQLEQWNKRYRAVTSKGSYIARSVVIATGPFQQPFVPDLQGSVSDEIYQIHSSEYQRSSQLREGSVLVIGAGNSGTQIAAELSNVRKVYLSSGHEIKFVPHRILGRSIFWWFYKLGLSRITVNSRWAKFLQYEPVIGLELQPLLESGKVELKPRTSSFHGREITFADGTEATVANIIWATGFQSNYQWVNVPGVVDRESRPIHNRGVTAAEGIYYLGLHWLYRRDSAQISGVGKDAKYLFDHLANYISKN